MCVLFDVWCIVCAKSKDDVYYCSFEIMANIDSVIAKFDHYLCAYVHSMNLILYDFTG